MDCVGSNYSLCLSKEEKVVRLEGNRIRCMAKTEVRWPRRVMYTQNMLSHLVMYRPLSTCCIVWLWSDTSTAVGMIVELDGSKMDANS